MNQKRLIQSEFLDYLITNDIAPGDSLPTLAEISDELGVSIGKLREEVACARADGIVSVKPRVGMRREAYDFLPGIIKSIGFALATGDAHFNQLSQLRKAVESSLWHDAIPLLTDQNISNLQSLIDSALRALASGKIPHREHEAFHLGMFANIDNPFATGILRSYWTVYTDSEFNSYKPFSYWEEVWAYHQRIVDNIVAKSFEEARLLLIEHFNLLETTPTVASHNGSN